MFQHGPTCLKGPRSRKRTQWRRPVENQDDLSFRADLVARIRREIAEGVYETEEKLDIALDRLLARLEKE